jgi:hypothetical protein
MTAVGGSIIEFSFAGRIFAVPADNDAQIKLGGFTNEAQANGNSTSRLIKTRVPLGIDGLLVEINHSNGDLEFLQDAANLKTFQDFAVTLADDTVYSGLGQITGDFQGSTQNATAPINLMGTGRMTRS